MGIFVVAQMFASVRKPLRKNDTLRVYFSLMPRDDKM